MRSRRAGLLLAVLVGGAVALVGGVARAGLDGLAEAIVARATPALADARGLDVVVRVEAGAAASTGAAGTVAELVAARLGRGGPRVVDVWRAGVVDGRGTIEEQARRAGYERVVALTLESESGRVRARGAVIAVEGGPWVARAETRAQLWAAVPLDEELRVALAMPATPTPTPTPTPIPTPTPEPAGPVRVRTIALPADLDVVAASVRAGRVAVATAREVIVFELRGERAVERARLALDGEWAASPSRAPVGAVRLQHAPDGDAIVVEARSSVFSDGTRWKLDGSAGAGRVPTGRVRGFPLDALDGGCELAAGADWFTPSGCGRQAGALPERFWSAVELVRRDGSRVEAAIIPATVDERGYRAAKLWLRDRGAPALEVVGVGAQLGLGALPRGEVVVTADSLADGSDAITLRAVAPGLPVVHRLERVGLVRAISVGDADGDGRAEVAAVVRDVAQRRTELVLLQ